MPTRLGRGAICLLAVAVYYNTLEAGFVYDDSVAVLSNPDVVGSRPLSELWMNDFWGTDLTSSNSHGSYRPLCVLSYRLTHAACGFRPSCYHLVNVVLHGLATALVHKTGLLILTRQSATVAGLIFAVHPIHTEAVAGVVGRADLLATVFVLLSLLTYAEHVKLRDSSPRRLKRSRSDASSSSSACDGSRSKRRTTPDSECGKESPRKSRHGVDETDAISVPDWLYLTVSIALAGCATLCKETGITVLAVSALYDLLLHKQLNIFKADRGVRSSVMAVAAAAAVGLCLRLHIMGISPPNFSASDNPTAKSPMLITRILTFFYLPAVNAWMIIYPRWLSFDWGMDAVPRIERLSDARNLATVVLFTLTALMLRRLAVKPRQEMSTRIVRHRLTRSQGILLSFALLVLPFIPASNLFFYVGFVIAERVLYLPSVGYCLLLGAGYSALCRTLGSRLPRLGLLVLIMTYAARTAIRNADWKDDESLYRSGIPINPPKAWGNLGSILNSQGRLEEAEHAYRSALSFRPNMADVHYNLGVLLHGRERHDEAIRSYQMAIAFRPSLAIAYLNLGTLLESRGRWKEAEAVLTRCSMLDSRGVKDLRTHEASRASALLQLGRMYADRGEYTRAVAVYTQAVYTASPAVQPQILYNLLGESLSKLNRHEEAERWFKASLEIKPDHVPAHLTYGKLLAKNRTRLSEAEEWFKRAQKLAPLDPSVYIHFGQFLEEVGRFCEAGVVYKKAVELAPLLYEAVEGAAAALRRAGSKAEAEMYYRRAVAIRPTDASSHSNLGAILHMNGKGEEAAAHYQQALKLDPTDPTTLANLAKLRSVPEAKDEMTALASRHPQSESQVASQCLPPADHSTITRDMVASRQRRPT